ncbi:putative membrane protein [Rhodoglobus vestalii]|uniref:Putative membrane protein n=1 Tax=Rhodoglobus vestalii TaxID=193384 RepID=A0A8H2PUV4_9MICO|nr:hypothetical protein [Rhodoglobus vestalii]TQO20137.1 putative membrane protein [Rhodoglobus vestalii]
MTKDTPQATHDYLSQLEAALSGVEPDVRGEIVAGIREELDGLDAEAAASRIEGLGDPAFIAAEAKAATPDAERATPTGPPPGRTLSIIAVLLLIVGSFIVPVVGPFVGLVWISLSAAWTRREKLTAWLTPLAAAIVVAVAVTIFTAVQSQAAADPLNPLVPFAGLAGLAGWHLAILLPFLVLPVVGIALLVRANNRNWRV